MNFSTKVGRALKALFYKSLNKLCTADITRVLFLDRDNFDSPEFSADIVCDQIYADQLRELSKQGKFGITESFISDFKEFEFLAIASSIDNNIIGVIFLSTGLVPGRHNSGGTAFNGIAVNAPPSCYYLFKVDVLEQFRGRRANAAMIAYAISHLGKSGLKSIVTTTDWTNYPFLKSAGRLGFEFKGHASEIVFRGKHYFQLPKWFKALHGQTVKKSAAAEADAIRFSGELS